MPGWQNWLGGARTRARIGGTLTRRGAISGADWVSSRRRRRKCAAWLQRQRDVIARAKTIRSLRNQESEVAAVLQNEKQQLTKELAATGHDVDPSQKSLDEVRDEAQTVVESIEGLIAERGQLERDVKRLQNAETQAQREHAEAESRLGEWRKQWKAAIANVPKVTADEPAEANQILELLYQLSLKLNNAEQQQGRLTEMDAFREEFQRQVTEVTQLVAPELLNGQALERVATEILRALATQSSRTKSKNGSVANWQNADRA